MFFSFISLLLLIFGISTLLKLTPEQIGADVMQIVSPVPTLRDQAQAQQKKKKGQRRLSRELARIYTMLESAGRGKQFAKVMVASLILMLVGVSLSIGLQNYFLLPVLAIALALLPFVYVKSTMQTVEKHTDMELETALSIITTAYIRNDDFVQAVKENLRYIKPPVQQIFEAFTVEVTTVSADIVKALYHMREKIDNHIFAEWCDGLISCQYDRSLKTSLLPIIDKMTDVRTVNEELKTALYEPRREYATMVALLIGNIPLLYLLNKDWYATLMSSIGGKLVIAVSAVAIIITALLAVKYTKPQRYIR